MNSRHSGSVHDAARDALAAWDRVVQATEHVAELDQVTAAMEKLRDAIENPPRRRESDV